MAAPTVSEPRRPDEEADAAVLSVMAVGPGFNATLALPAQGIIVIGRSEDADLRIVDPLASRNHARFHIGTAVEIEDLGSANGTRFREQLLVPGERTLVGVGEAVTIGSTVLLLQRRERPVPVPICRPHGYFEARLIEECARAEGVRGSFALARLSVGSAADAASAEAVLEPWLRPGDVMGAYGPGEYELLLTDSDRPASEQRLAALVAAMQAAGAPARMGIAHFPADATSPGALFARACVALRLTAGSPVAPGRTVVASPVMRELFALAERVAASSINVLILGETGAGKEVLAETIHRRSARGGGPLVYLNCAALTETLLESELFGHEKGAFSGAGAAKPGLLEAGSGGSVFLDEVGEMSPSLQAKLLRALETRQVLRVGAISSRSIDVRFIAATNRDLEEEVAARTFRQDLYFRLNGITLNVPPLRERVEEIVPLARQFLENAADQVKRPAPALTQAAVAALESYSWPGNVRELKNLMERALLFASGSVVDSEHLPLEKLRRSSPIEPQAGDVGELRDFRARKIEIEREAILHALERCGGNQTRAAELLGMPRRTFCNRLTEYGIRSRRT